MHQFWDAAESCRQEALFIQILEALQTSHSTGQCQRACREYFLQGMGRSVLLWGANRLYAPKATQTYKDQNGCQGVYSRQVLQEHNKHNFQVDKNCLKLLMVTQDSAENQLIQALRCFYALYFPHRLFFNIADFTEVCCYFPQVTQIIYPSFSSSCFYRHNTQHQLSTSFLFLKKKPCFSDTSSFFSEQK